MAVNQFYDKVRGFILRGTRANQPAVADVFIGSIYYVTDENILERSNGTIWESYSGSSGSGSQGLRGMPGMDGIDGEDTGLIVLSSNLNGLISEGSWTPTDASGAGLTFVTSVGRWIKIGPMVFASCNVRYPVTSNGAQAAIGSFPFYTQSDAGVYWGGAVTYSNADVGSVNLNENFNSSKLYSAPPLVVAQTNAQMSNLTVIFNIQYKAFTV